MSTINQKLGFKPQTRTRAATHAPALAANQHCPVCRSTHVLRTLSENGQRAGDYWCGACHAFWFNEDRPEVAG